VLTSKKPMTVKEKDLLSAERWCRYFISVCYACIIVNLVVLIAVWYFFAFNKAGTDPIRYWTIYIILPSSVMLIANVVAHFLVLSKKIPTSAKEYISMLLILFFCTYLCFTYSIVAVLMASFIVPVFVSTIFSNTRMTAITYALSQILLVLIGMEMYFFSTRTFGYWIWIEMLVASGLLIASYLLARVFIVYGKDNISKFRDIYNDKISLEEQLNLDPLLGLYNRKAYNEFLPQLMMECRRKNLPLSIAILDLDNFKRINDLYGHASGDRVLLKFAEILKKNVPDNIYAFRVGGEEFVLLFEGYAVDEADKVCDNLLSITRAASLPELKDEMITFSGGIAGMNRDYTDPEGLFKAADAALYSAKNSGKNKIIIT